MRANITSQRKIGSVINAGESCGRITSLGKLCARVRQLSLMPRNSIRGACNSELVYYTQYADVDS